MAPMAPTYIPRVPTVISFKQLEEEETAVQPIAGPLAPVSTCPGTTIPFYGYSLIPPAKRVLQRVDSRSQVLAGTTNADTSSGSCDVLPSCSSSDDEASSAGASPSFSSGGSQQLTGPITQNSVLDTVLLALWEDCSEQGLFRYDVTACPTKVLSGQYGFIAQLNEGRATKKRPTEFRVDQVCQPFDDSKFNFNKALMREVLLQFEPSRSRHGGPQLLETATASSSPNLVFINVSPIEYGHVLLVPRVLDCIPQLADESTVRLALHFCHEADNPYFRVGYNSLGAYATINHLHFQAYYLAAPFPCERAPTAPISGLKRKRGNVLISRLTDYPVNGFVVESESCHLASVAAVVGAACVRMQEANIPHNIIIADRGCRVFIWPQAYAERQARGEVPQELLDTGVNPAAFEIAGHMVLKRKEDYDAMSQDLAWRMLQQVSLDEQKFHEVARLCFA